MPANREGRGGAGMGGRRIRPVGVADETQLRESGSCTKSNMQKNTTQKIKGKCHWHIFISF